MLKREWTGRYVRLLRSTENVGGNVFAIGQVMEVIRNHGGLRLKALGRCQCGGYMYHSITGVSEAAVELLPANYRPEGLDSLDPLVRLEAQLAAQAQALTEAQGGYRNATAEIARLEAANSEVEQALLQAQQRLEALVVSELEWRGKWQDEAVKRNDAEELLTEAQQREQQAQASVADYKTCHEHSLQLWREAQAEAAAWQAAVTDALRRLDWNHVADIKLESEYHQRCFSEWWCGVVDALSVAQRTLRGTAGQALLARLEAAEAFVLVVRNQLELIGTAGPDYHVYGLQAGLDNLKADLAAYDKAKEGSSNVGTD